MHVHETELDVQKLLCASARLEIVQRFVIVAGAFGIGTELSEDVGDLGKQHYDKHTLTPHVRRARFPALPLRVFTTALASPTLFW